VPLEIRRLIREISFSASDPRRAPQVRYRYRADEHGEIHGAEEATAAWKTFLRNHADEIAAMDLFVVRTVSFRLLFGFLILRHDRRRILSVGVTAHSTAEWIARQLTEAFGWDRAPRYLIRDRDRAYGEVVTRRLRAQGIRDRDNKPAKNVQRSRSV
jgi:hypothetical protein